MRRHVSSLKTINIELAVQVRLGREKDGAEQYPSAPIGSGIVIFGGD